jgi:hypothetical protein
MECSIERGLTERWYALWGPRAPNNKNRAERGERGMDISCGVSLRRRGRVKSRDRATRITAGRDTPMEHMYSSAINTAGWSC